MTKPLFAGKTFNKADLKEKLFAAFPSIGQVVLEEIINETIVTLVEGIRTHKITYCIPLGTFSWYDTKATKRKVFGGKTVDVPSKKRLRFRPSEVKT